MSLEALAADRAPRLRTPAVWLSLAALLLAALLVLASRLRADRAPPLPALGRLPAFTFTRQDGRPFGREELLGKPWVANFIFTRCPTVCPLFTAKMAGLQARSAPFASRLALVSFSVDPRYDTPERLAAYALKHGADGARWSFLTGDFEQLKATVVGGFKVSMGRDSPDEEDVLGIFHGTHFVLVDATGEIRGYYNSDDEAAVARLLIDAERLARE